MQIYSRAKKEEILKYINGYYYRNYAYPSPRQIGRDTGLCEEDAKRYLISMSDEHMINYSEEKGIISTPDILRWLLM